ncbi:transcription initiation factor IIF subunit alpha, partial [Tanacetum coccineum]
EVKVVQKKSGSDGKNSKGASSSKRASASGRVTENEIREVLLHKAPITTQSLVTKFKSRIRTKKVCSFWFS